MNLKRNIGKIAGVVALVAATIGLAVPAVQSQNRTRIKIDGSSTVFPITEAVAEEFQNEQNARVQVTVGISGTGGGFKKFCSDNPSVRTHISDASRPMKKKEQDMCRAQGIEYIELPVAYDAITIVINRNNSWAESMTTDDLKKMWDSSGQGRITRWSQVNPSWPNAPLNLYGPGADSGTFDYFNEVIIGKGNSSRGDYTASEDDNVLVQGVANDKNAIGYFGLAYYLENKDKIRAVAVDGVLPSPYTVNNGTYTPLSRPIYIYVNKKAADDVPALKRFVEYYLQNAREYVEEVGYVSLSAADYQKALDRFQNRETGRVSLREGL